MPAERIAAFIRGESDDSFDELALAAFRDLYKRIEIFRDLCDQRGVMPEQLSDWRQVPAVPISELERLNRAVMPAEDQPYPDLRQVVIDHSCPAACLAAMGRPPVLSLMPSGEDTPEPDLALMGDRLLRTRAAPDSAVAVARRGVEAAKARSFLGARQRDRRPTVILATSTSLTQLLEALDRRGLRFRLPPGSKVIDTGGPAPGHREMLVRLADGLAVPPEDVVRGYGVGGLASRFYAGHNRRGEQLPFRPPPWARARALDPETLAESPAGAEGVLAVLDLASPGAAVHLLTEDVAVDGEGGFRLAGRTAAPTV